jgi:hypothetical protein
MLTTALSSLVDEGTTRQLSDALTLVRLRRVLCAGFAAFLWSGQMSSAQQPIDIYSYFQKARDLGRDGLARKTKTVDVREAKPGEIVVTVIKGEGQETQSPPAKAGDRVVRNRCPETGNEEFLVSASKFADRYEGPSGPAGEDGWRPYRPRGADMRFVVVTEEDGEFTFTAPWGEKMIARPGDAIVQDAHDPKDTYRVQKASFACTYEEIRRPAR